MPTDTSTQTPTPGVPTVTSQPPTPPSTDNTFGTVPNQSGIPLAIPTPDSSGGTGKSRRGWLFAVIGILFLAGAVGAGVYLTQQNQGPEQASTADLFCGAVNDPNNNLITSPACSSDNVCWQATTTNMCLVNGQPQGAVEYFVGNGTWDGQVCYKCESGGGVIVDNPGTVVCSAGTLTGGNPSLCPGGGTPVATATAAPSKAVCGEACVRDEDCADATIPQVTVSCKQGKCVNKACFDRGGDTVFGTRCDCSISTGTCGEPCGAAIGLCDASLGLTCTYLAQSQCSPSTKWPVCVPVGTGANSRGPMKNVPLYQDAAFERRRCGNSTSDPDNNFIYHPAFTSGLTTAQVNQFICNPQPPEVLSGQCVSVLVYDTNWNLLDATAQSALKAGDVIRVTVNGTSSQGAIDQARFTFNGTLRAPVTQKKTGTQEFYDEITIPVGATTLSIKGELHHPTLGWF